MNYEEFLLNLVAKTTDENKLLEIIKGNEADYEKIFYKIAIENLD